MAESVEFLEATNASLARQLEGAIAERDLLRAALAESTAALRVGSDSLAAARQTMDLLVEERDRLLRERREIAQAPGRPLMFNVNLTPTAAVSAEDADDIAAAVVAKVRSMFQNIDNAMRLKDERDQVVEMLKCIVLASGSWDRVLARAYLVSIGELVEIPAHSEGAAS